MSKFEFEVKKFSTNSSYFISDFNVGNHKIIAKYITTNNDSNIWNSINTTLLDLSSDNDLSFFDKILGLLKIKVLCIAPSKIKLSATCPDTKKKFDVTIDAVQIYDNLYNAIENITSIIIEDENHEIILFHPYYPKWTTDELDIVTGLINQIKIKSINKTISFKDLSFEDKKRIYDALPSSLTYKVSEEIKKIETKLNDCVLFKLHSPYSRGTTIEMKMSLRMEIIMEVLKLMFALDLAEHYRICFALCRDAHFSLTEIDQMTPSEKIVYWKQYQEQIASQTKIPDNQINVAGMSAPSGF